MKMTDANHRYFEAEIEEVKATSPGRFLERTVLRSVEPEHGSIYGYLTHLIALDKSIPA